MKKFWKTFKKYRIGAIPLFILFFGIIIRFYNFSDRVVYGPEQGISLISAAGNFGKPSLLGIPYLLRQTSDGLRIFTAPVFGYTLIPLILIFNYDPLKITIFFALINIFTGILIYLIGEKTVNRKVAIFSSILFFFSSKMIYHSTFIWTSNYMPFIGTLTIYLIYLFYKTKKISYVFLLGLLSGVGFGIQYFYIIGIVFVFLIILYFTKKKFKNTLIFISGFVLGELPTLLFDLKHNFYHFKTLTAYFWEIFKKSGESQISYYHFLFLYPLLALIGGFLLWSLYKKNKYISFVLVAVYLITNTKIPSGMPHNLSAKDVLSSAKLIASGNPKDFNVTVVGNFDNRGYTLRYPLEYIYKINVDSVENYTNTTIIYVLGRKDYNFDKPDIWELRTFLPYKVYEVKSVNDYWSLYKLIK